MKNKKRVISIGLDIVVGCECDGNNLAKDIKHELNRRGYKVVGAEFNYDLTDMYKEQCPELLED